MVPQSRVPHIHILYTCVYKPFQTRQRQRDENHVGAYESRTAHVFINRLKRSFCDSGWATGLEAPAGALGGVGRQCDGQLRVGGGTVSGKAQRAGRGGRSGWQAARAGRRGCDSTKGEGGVIRSSDLQTVRAINQQMMVAGAGCRRRWQAAGRLQGSGGVTVTTNKGRGRRDSIIRPSDGAGDHQSTDRMILGAHTCV